MGKRLKNPSPDGRLPFGEVFWYGAGDLANNLIAQMVLVYLLVFYTDIFGIPAAAAGAIFVVTRIVDAVTDILMGIIVDKVTLKSGKLRGWIRIGAIPFGVLAVLCFVTPPFGTTGKIIWAYVTYNLLSCATTMINIPYMSLPGAMTQSQHELTRLSAIRTVFTVIGALSVTILVPIIAASVTGGNLQTGYPIAMGMFVIVGVFIYFMLSFKCQERYVAAERSRLGFKETLRSIFHNKPLILLAVVMAFNIGSTNLRAASIAYYFKYYLGNEGLMAVYLVIVYVCNLSGVFIGPALTRKFSRKGIMQFSIIFFAVTNSVIFFIPKTANLLFFIVSAFAAIGTSLSSILIYTLLPDAVEYGEYMTGVRTEGSVYSLVSFATKVGSAIGGAVPAWILAAVNFVPNVEQALPAQTAINAMMTVVPSAILLVAFVIMLFYNVTEDKFKFYLTENNKKREAAGTREPGAKEA